jgi:hypothetical protein
MPSAKIIRFVHLGRRRQILVLESLAAIAASSAAVRFLPFRWAIRIGSRKLSKAAAADRNEILRDARWSIEAVAARVPWRAVCLQQGLALQWMLRMRGIDAVLHYGLAKEKGEELEAHAWVAVGDNLIIGGEIAPKFRCVATFPESETATTAQ